MKFTIVLTALVAVAVAAPASNAVRDVDAADNVDAPELCIHIRGRSPTQDYYFLYLLLTRRDCVEALSPSIKACAKAARDKGKNLHEDADCLKEALDASISAVRPPFPLL